MHPALQLLFAVLALGGMYLLGYVIGCRSAKWSQYAAKWSQYAHGYNDGMRDTKLKQDNPSVCVDMEV